MIKIKKRQEVNLSTFRYTLKFPNDLSELITEKNVKSPSKNDD